LRYFPLIPVSKPLACNQVAMVDRSSWTNDWKRPYGGLFRYTSVPCEYFPVRIVVRLGQHSGFTTNALRNVTPFPASSDATAVMWLISETVWSSERISTMFGLPFSPGEGEVSGGAGIGLPVGLGEC